MKYIKRAKELLGVEIAGLRKVQAGLGREFSAAVRLVLGRLKAGGKLVVTGVGKNLPIGQKIAATLTSTGCPAVFLHPSDAMHGDLGILQANDVLLALSYSGESEELLQLIPVVKRCGVATIAMTGRKDSGLSRECDVMIPVAVDREACPFNLAPTASTTATLAVGDALAIVLLEARGFRKEDYAKLHPGGAIGRTLLMRVADIMRCDERIAKVTRGTRVRDAVLAMTAARAGSVAIVDAKGRVLGICTDGDLRRHIMDGKNLSGMTVDKVMTPRPIVIQQDCLAVDALAIYEKHNIDDLIVVDGQNRLVGMVDIQDLPKFKIF